MIVDTFPFPGLLKKFAPELPPEDNDPDEDEDDDDE